MIGGGVGSFGAGPLKFPVLYKLDSALMIPAVPICRTDELLMPPILRWCMAIDCCTNIFIVYYCSLNHPLDSYNNVGLSVSPLAPPASLSDVTVALKPLFVTGKSPVLNDPDPAYVFEVLFGAIYRESPKLTIPPLPTLTTLTPPTIAGIHRPPLQHLDW